MNAKLNLMVRADSDRIKIVDLVRSASIFLVLIGHFFSVRFDPQRVYANELERNILNCLYFLGCKSLYGVSMFFVVSGFVISRITAIRYGSLYNVSSRQFYKRRIARIVPLLSLISVLGLIAVARGRIQGGTETEQMSFIFSPSQLDGWFFFRYSHFPLIGC